MPKVSEFYGIAIYFYYREHSPPHFHAVYGANDAQIAIDALGVIRGHLPPRALSLVREWASLHATELRRAWEQARDEKPVDSIEPLT